MLRADLLARKRRDDVAVSALRSALAANAAVANAAVANAEAVPVEHVRNLAVDNLPGLGATEVPAEC